MQEKTATIIGATGLIGSHILKLIYDDDNYEIIRLITRRPLSLDHPKLDIHVINFQDEGQYREAIAGSEVVFCAVGTTNAKVDGDKDAYRKIDYDIPVDAARFAGETGCKHYLLVSAAGADSASRVFYSRLKGEVEEAVVKCGIPTVSIFQPSMLLGDRSEFRLGERIGQVLMSVFSFMIPQKYKPIEAADVARAMVKASEVRDPGVRVFQYKEMQALV